MSLSGNGGWGSVWIGTRSWRSISVHVFPLGLPLYRLDQIISQSTPIFPSLSFLSPNIPDLVSHIGTHGVTHQRFLWSLFSIIIIIILIIIINVILLWFVKYFMLIYDCKVVWRSLLFCTSIPQTMDSMTLLCSRLISIKVYFRIAFV